MSWVTGIAPSQTEDPRCRKEVRKAVVLLLQKNLI